MIIIGGDKFAQSSTGVKEMTDADFAGTAATAALNIWLAAPPAKVGSTVPWPDVFTYPEDASGFWLTVVSSDVSLATGDTVNRTISFLQAGAITLTWIASNADGTSTTYQMPLTITV